MSRLKQKIIEEIRSKGHINFETFMEMCLYYPELGYYTRDSSKIGKAGDFYTSPHLHPIFGAMIARQMIEMWEIMERPQDFQIIEIGAGMGYLAKDTLDYLKSLEIKCLGKFFKNIQYIIVEMNPYMRLKQEGLLSEYKDKIIWVSNINEIGSSIRGCFLSNELLDAFPVRLIEMDNGIKEIYVSVDGDRFIEVKRPCSKEILDYLDDFGIKLPEGYRTEVNLKIKEWLNDVNNKLSEGFIMTIDYGYTSRDYYNEERNRGTLLCYHRHQVNEDPFTNIGEQDITAHVNFSFLKKLGDEFGIKTLGFCPQGTYLVSLGIDEVIMELFEYSQDILEIGKIKGLILPQGMGESHKVMIQYKGNKDIKIMKGFMIKNYKDKL